MKVMLGDVGCLIHSAQRHYEGIIFKCDRKANEKVQEKDRVQETDSRIGQENNLNNINQ